MQAYDLLAGQKIARVESPTSPHKFTWYNGDPADYSGCLTGRTIKKVKGYGVFVDLIMDEETHLLIGDGTNMRYFPAGEAHPLKHQLLVEMEDGGFLVFTVAMYGAIYAFKGDFDNPYYQGSMQKLSPLDEHFDEAYFETLIRATNKDLSAKALLTTKQRIPGLGNGVVQDILFQAAVHPKSKVSALSGIERTDLFYSIKGTLKNMLEAGGRDTEKDFFGNWGGYKTILSKKTYKAPCRNCGHEIVRENYLGGTIYYCPVCQLLKG